MFPYVTTFPYVSLGFPTFPYVPLRFPTFPYVTLRYPTFPYVSLRFPMLPYVSLCFLRFPMFPYVSLCFLTLPYVSLCFPTFPYVSDYVVAVESSTSEAKYVSLTALVAMTEPSFCLSFKYMMNGDDAHRLTVRVVTTGGVV